MQNLLSRLATCYLLETSLTYQSILNHFCREAAQEFVGAHDFKQFSSIPALDPLPNPVKTIYKMELLEDGQDLTIRMDGSGFLYNQCRHMVGCLIQVGLGTMSAEDVSRLLKIGSSQHPGMPILFLRPLACQDLKLNALMYDLMTFSSLRHPIQSHSKTPFLFISTFSNSRTSFWKVLRQGSCRSEIQGVVTGSATRPLLGRGSLPPT